MKKLKFSWRESSEDSFWSLDKVEHFLLHFFLTLFFGLLFNIWVAIIVSEIIGFGTELLEITPVIWIKLMKLLGEGKTDKGADFISIKDLIMNNLRMIVGIILIILLNFRFG
jgi:hypothetical protein